MMEIEHGSADPLARKPCQHLFDEGAAAERYGRLRDDTGDGIEAGAEAGRQDECREVGHRQPAGIIARQGRAPTSCRWLDDYARHTTVATTPGTSPGSNRPASVR